MRNREQYQQKLEAQLEAWGAEVDGLKARAKSASADAQIELKDQIHQLESRIEDGKKSIDELTSASDDAWETVKSGVDNAWESLTKAFSDATNKFKN